MFFLLACMLVSISYEEDRLFLCSLATVEAFFGAWSVKAY